MLQFHFHPDGIISVQGYWELADSDGIVIDSARENSERDAYRLHVILGKNVARFAIDPPQSISLVFETGHVLTIYDDSPQYESFSINPGNIYI